MKNVLILNAHHYYPFSEGKLNAALIETADAFFKAKGYQTRVVNTQDEFDVETELENHHWADIVFLQSPINWMGMTWSFKKYMDEVYTAGMGGALCHGDGRHQDNPKANYGKGGTLNNTQYMMSLTLNAPAESFADAADFFEGKSVDDLVFPMHMNFKFFGMQALATFACYDVMKNADIDSDFARFEKHLNENF